MSILCQHSNCTNEATTAGYIYGHERGNKQGDKFFRVYACDTHKESSGFFEDKQEKDEQE